eukprot:7384507-Prymnesium_polylepis.2
MPRPTRARHTHPRETTCRSAHRCAQTLRLSTFLRLPHPSTCLLQPLSSRHRLLQRPRLLARSARHGTAQSTHRSRLLQAPTCSRMPRSPST